VSGEVIEVCQECGHIIEPQDVTAPWGDRYRITLCLRDECIADRLAAELRTRPLYDEQVDAMRYALAFTSRLYIPLVTNDPGAFLRSTGI
jgi:hypothetical protein